MKGVLNRTFIKRYGKVDKCSNSRRHKVTGNILISMFPVACDTGRLHSLLAECSDV